MGDITYLDGAFVSQALLPARDLAVLRGYGVFDYLRTYGGRPFALTAHLERLARSAAMIGLDLPLALPQIEAVTLEALERSDYPEATVRIIVTGGDSPDNLLPGDEARLLVMVARATPMPAEWYRDGIHIITEHTERYLPEAKTINYIPAIIALQRGRRVGALDAIYINQQGYALEGTTTNLFAFFGDTLVTPGAGMLRGITREAVIELARASFRVELRDLPLADLLRADEVFLTSSNKEICPVRQIDSTVIGPPGPRTRALITAFNAMTRAYAAEAAPF